MGAFADDLKRYCESRKVDVQVVVRKTALDLLASVVSLSPVDTGRFRGNWQIGIGRLDTTTSTKTDETGELTIARGRDALIIWEAGLPIWIGNSLPYAQRLEHGWSHQAPSGMVRLTVQRFQEFVSNQVKALK